jgi:ATP-dependent Clp protease ATP-binding subunit ClpA
MFHIGLIGAGTRSKAEFEERLDTVMAQIRAGRDCIVVIEDVRLLVGPGPVEGAVDTARILKPAVSRGEIQCICIATADEYRTILATDPLLHRCFQTVVVPQRRVEERYPSNGASAERKDNDNERLVPFTTRSHWVLSFAQEEAHCFNHNSIGTEHLLLGMIRESNSIAAKVLQSLGVQLPAARCTVALLIGRGDHIMLGYSGLSPRARKVVELASDEARRLKHHYVGTQHLLLGLVREREGVGVRVLESLGVSCEQVRSRTMQVLHRNSAAVDPVSDRHD